MSEAQGVIELRQMISEARADIVHADQKASAILAAVGVGFSVLLGGQLAAGWSFWVLEPGPAWMWWSAVVLVLVGLVSSALVLWPRLRLSASPSGRLSFWAHATAFSSSSNLARAAKDLKEDEELERRSVQLFELARIARLKFVLLRVTLIAVGAGSALFGMVAVLPA